MFLVKYEMEGEIYSAIEKPIQIFNKMDMADCYELYIEGIWDLDPDHYLEECVFYGTWHDPSCPLKMEIRRKKNNKFIVGGFGTDH